MCISSITTKRKSAEDRYAKISNTTTAIPKRLSGWSTCGLINETTTVHLHHVFHTFLHRHCTIST